MAAVLAVVLPALGIVGAWRITAGEDELLHVAQFLDLLVSPWMLATYAAVAALIAASVAFLRFGHRVVGQGGDLEV
ncbi:hypothetical protein, partial [Reyranella sp.]|uniref:hypothetical protein n=1 Tax=Reyranella sp. TaxID=1929291 RepID=UPI003D09E20E